jgi:hypothetical protein
MLFTCARLIHINTDRKQLKQVLHFRFSFEPRFSEVDKSLFLAPPLRTTSCNVHYSGPILYDNESTDDRYKYQMNHSAKIVSAIFYEHALAAILAVSV